MSRIFWCMLLLSAANVWAGPLVQFRTVYGDIEVELFEDKPVTTRNFIRYTQGGFYQNLFFHRWIPGFVIQSGGYVVANRGTPNEFIGGILPFYGQITNEFLVGRKVSNTYGTIAMAKTPDGPNTATSEWFFNIGNNSTNLDNQNGGFTVFGKVIRGTNVLTRFNGSPTNGLYILNGNAPFTDLPVFGNGDVLFVDVSLVNTQVKLAADKTREITWNSVLGRTNYIEYTPLTTSPPTWTQLAATNGNGLVMKVVDSSPANANRFYRVRIDYPAHPLP